MASLAAGGTLGILIPPRIDLIVYGVLIEESIKTLHLTNFKPEIMLALMMIVMIIGASILFQNIAPKELPADF